MNTLLTNAWFVGIAIGACVFVLSYINADRALAFIHKRSIGTQDEVFAMLERMLLEIDRKRIKLLLNLLSFGMGAMAFLALWPNVVPGLIFGAGFTMIGWYLPKLYVTNLWERRCNRLVDQMVDGLTIMGNSIKAGQSITQAMERVVENMPGPLAQEYALMLNKVRLGLSVEAALNEFGDRIPRQDVQMFVTAVTVLKETGGNLAETFATIVITIRERQKVEKKIQALTTQGQTQAIIITLVPFVLIGLFLVIDPNFIMPVFTRPLGWFMLAVMVGLQTIGLVMMKRIVTIKV